MRLKSINRDIKKSVKIWGQVNSSDQELLPETKSDKRDSLAALEFTPEKRILAQGEKKTKFYGYFNL